MKISPASGRMQNMERLHKVLAHAGVGSRRQCESIIKAGRVRYKFSAFFGGLLDDTDFVSARVFFRTAEDSLISAVDVPTITRLERANQTGLSAADGNAIDSAWAEKADLAARR